MHTEPHVASNVAKLNWLRASVLGANATRAALRVVAGGTLAMIVTYTIGRIFGVTGI